MKRLIFSFAFQIWIFFGLSVGAHANQSASSVQSILVDGASSICLLMQPAASQFARVKRVGVSVKTSGSKATMECLKKNTCDVGLLPEEVLPKDPGNLVVVPFAIAGVEIIVSSGAGVDNLSLEQARNVFSGRVKNWREVGGKSMPIEVIRRRDSSALHKLFSSYIPVANSFKEINTSLGIANLMKKSPSVVSYISGGLPENPDYKFIKIGNVAPTAENLRNGSYRLRLKYFIVYDSLSAKLSTIKDLTTSLLEAREELFKVGGLILP